MKIDRWSALENADFHNFDRIFHHRITFRGKRIKPERAREQIDRSRFFTAPWRAVLYEIIMQPRKKNTKRPNFPREIKKFRVIVRQS